MSFVKKRIANSILLAETDMYEIIQLINSSDINKATSPNGISAKILKISKEVIAPYLSGNCNQLLGVQVGKYPKVLKIAKIIPVFKSGQKTSASNYRPISILSQSNKIVQKILHKRVTDFIDKYQILNNNQFGFRKQLSTNLALLKLHEELLENEENNLTTCLVFLDIRKAFDTVNYEILINKLEPYDIRGVAKNLLNSYLTEKMQYVQTEGVKSDKLLVSHGVPQGSVLGLLLFLLYINDLPSNLQINVKLFADDAVLYSSSKNLDTLHGSINNEL